MKTTVFVCFVTTAIILSSCILDKRAEEAKRIANSFIESIQTKKYEEALSYYSDGYLTKLGKQPQLEMFSRQESLYGDILSYRIKSFEKREYKEKNEVVYFVTHIIECSKARLEIITKYLRTLENDTVKLIEYFSSKVKE